ncbi:hypothetical protein ACIU1J_01800 [Azospirillum doebereinerae]|uniref:hypothetical protein n=1 Tax=Azospirillum doebereinerae TaxID=92933 RepID=UPI001EE57BC4|nr:hypothetical protein [Azospirillum doebereinerae]MCG5240065.1 hypothetical protein [Azospirillum doebereinerae]
MKHRVSKGAPAEQPAIVRKMGRKIADMAGSGEPVTKEDLLTDFSAAAIDQHIEAARGFARELLGDRIAA